MEGRYYPSSQRKDTLSMWVAWSRMDSGERWYYTKQQLEDSPSRKRGFDAARELFYRQHASVLLHRMGKKLFSGHNCIATAIMYMQRFYMYHPLDFFPFRKIAISAFFLASKSTEKQREAAYVIRIERFSWDEKRENELDPQSFTFKRKRDDLLYHEELLLQALGFDLTVELPHLHIINFCKKTNAPRRIRRILNYMICNVMVFTYLCLQYKPRVIACFVIQFVSRMAHWTIPDIEGYHHWYHWIDPNVTQLLMSKLTHEFKRVYEKSPSRLKTEINRLYAPYKGDWKKGSGSSSSGSSSSNDTEDSSSSGNSSYGFFQSDDDAVWRSSGLSSLDTSSAEDSGEEYSYTPIDESEEIYEDPAPPPIEREETYFSLSASYAAYEAFENAQNAQMLQNDTLLTLGAIPVSGPQEMIQDQSQSNVYTDVLYIQDPDEATTSTYHTMQTSQNYGTVERSEIFPDLFIPSPHASPSTRDPPIETSTIEQQNVLYITDPSGSMEINQTDNTMQQQTIFLPQNLVLIPNNEEGSDFTIEVSENSDGSFLQSLLFIPDPPGDSTIEMNQDNAGEQSNILLPPDLGFITESQQGSNSMEEIVPMDPSMQISAIEQANAVSSIILDIEDQLSYEMEINQDQGTIEQDDYSLVVPESLLQMDQNVGNYGTAEQSISEMVMIQDQNTIEQGNDLLVVPEYSLPMDQNDPNFDFDQTGPE